MKDRKDLVAKKLFGIFLAHFVAPGINQILACLINFTNSSVLFKLYDIDALDAIYIAQTFLK